MTHFGASFTFLPTLRRLNEPLRH